MQHFLWLGMGVESLHVQRKGICGIYVLPKYGNSIADTTDTRDRSLRKAQKGLYCVAMGKIGVCLAWYLYTPPS